VARATEEAARTPAPTPARRAVDPEEAPPGGWRRWVPWVLVVVATVVVLLAALNVWVKRQALNTDNWTNSSEQLLQNDQIRQAISVYLVNQLYDNVNVGQALSDRLPPATKQLGPPLAAALQPALVRTTDTLLGRPRVQEAWKNANRRAHQLLMDVINGKHGLLVSTNGNVVLDLRPLLEQLVARTGIGERVLQKLPPDAGQIVLMKGNQLDVARKSVKVIRATSYFLVFLALALYGAAMYIARGRRRKMLMAAGVSVLLVGLIVLAVRRYAGVYLVDALTSNPDDKHAVNAAWAIGTNLLRNVGINGVIYGALAIISAWVAGPSRAARWIRRVSAPTMRDRPYIAYGVVTVLLLILLVSGPTDAQRVYPLLVVFALAFVGLEVLRRQTLREFPPAEEAAPAAPVLNP
jgi:hypothetical protein